MIQPYRLGCLLLQKRLINQQQLDAALIHQRQAGVPLGEALIALNIVNERQIKRALKKQSFIRLCAACVAFFMAPFSLCHASNEKIEHLPEYSFTQVADCPSLNKHADDFEDYAIDGFGQNLNIIEATTAAAWYLSQGGLADNQLNDVPVKMNLSTGANNSYKLHVSFSF